MLNSRRGRPAPIRCGVLNGASGKTGPICILKADLGSALIDIAEDLFRQSPKQAAEILSSYRLRTANEGFAIPDRLQSVKREVLSQTSPVRDRHSVASIARLSAGFFHGPPLQNLRSDTTE